jgi:diadenosine tetraphosphatase ApaH/serine/threonine PP2A family protein phosphatase
MQTLDIQDINGLTAVELVREVRMACSFSWTAGALATNNWLPWLDALPLDMRRGLPDGTHVLAVHAAPGTDDGDGINPATADESLRLLMVDAQADLVLVGHTHVQFERIINSIRVVNPGHISNPLPPDLRAGYALLQADQQGYQIVFNQVDYDRQAVIEAMQQRQHPSKEYVTRLMLGQVKPEWET